MCIKYHIVKKNGQWLEVTEYELLSGGESDLKGFKVGLGVYVVLPDPRHDHMYMPDHEYGGKSTYHMPLK